MQFFKPKKNTSSVDANKTFSRSKKVLVKKDEGIDIDDDIDLSSIADIPSAADSAETEVEVKVAVAAATHVPETPTKKTPVKKRISKEIPKTPTPASTITEPTTPKKPSNYHEYLKRKAAATPAEFIPLNREIPTTSSNGLEGKTFVLTGEMSALSREQAEDIIKRNGGKVTTSVSGRTSYIVVGSDPGPSKMEKAERLSIPQLDRDSFLDLIDSVASTPHHKKIKTDASANAGSEPIVESKPSIPKAVSQLPLKELRIPTKTTKNTMWTDRYAPQSSSELLGNPGNYTKLKEYLQSWPKRGNLKEAHPLCCLISGAPGTGKTTAVRLACKELGMDSLEFNASDCRSKKALHSTVKEVLSSGSRVESFFSGDDSSSSIKNNHKSNQKKKTRNVLVMDEVDGMSSGDRGGMAELLTLIKANRNTPVVCICNDASSPKVRSLLNYCLDLRWRRPEARTVQRRLLEICEKENLSVSPSAIDDLVLRTQGDIRQILMILSSYSMTHSKMGYDEAKGEALSSLKDIDKGPFDVVPGLLSGSAFQRGPSGRLQDKIDRYFVDSSLIPLMIQENYLKARPSTPRDVSANDFCYIPGQTSNVMSSYLRAADSISEADSYESLIRGSNQEWSLSPMHAVMSVVRPCFIVHGSMNARVDFPSWLGQNSKSGKLHRYLAELYRHTFLVLKCSSVFSMRLDYLPTLAAKIITSLKDASIDVCISLMDSYCLCRADVDLLLELMVSPEYDLAAYAKIPTTVKSSFTRKYNSTSHLLPYSIGALSTAAVKRIDVDVDVGQDYDDVDADDKDEKDEDEKDEDDNNDLAKDKMIVMKTKPKKSAGSSTKKSKVK